MTQDPRTVTLEPQDWMTVLDALENDELRGPAYERIIEAIRTQAGIA
jgi:Fe-S-cluster formation regulator IscX/YfhJ